MITFLCSMFRTYTQDAAVKRELMEKENMILVKKLTEEEEAYNLEEKLKLELMEKENRYLDKKLAADEEAYNSDMRFKLDMMKKESYNLIKPTKNLNNNQKEYGINANVACYVQKGVITHLTGNSGTLNKTIDFKSEVLKNVVHELYVGDVIEFLVFQNENKESKVVKIVNIIESNWEETSEAKIQDTIDSLNFEIPTYYDVETRNIYGYVSKSLPSSIEVDTEYGEINVELLDTIRFEINFIPKKGDTVCMTCYMQMDDGYLEQRGEILEIMKVFPARTEANQKCTVQRVFSDFAVLADNTYILKEDMPNSLMLHLGDFVMVDLIECKYSKFSRRAVKCKLLEKNFGEINKKYKSNETGNVKNSVVIEGDDRFVYTELWLKEKITFKLKNMKHRSITLQKVYVKNAKEAQISVVEPLHSCRLDVNGQLNVILEIQTKYIGESKEYFTLEFDSFKITRNITLIVCETSAEAQEAKLHFIAADYLMANGRTERQRSRSYTNKVYNSKSIVVPGEYLTTNRRFLKTRLLTYDVPATLRTIVLNSDCYEAFKNGVENLCPEITGELNCENYAQRFSTLLHLEEIDYTIHFRNYDQERGHFIREGTYLSLHIENLAERRPSLVLGDTVHAFNPFVSANSKEEKAFEGIVHKVLFDRVLLKFNSSFQQTYNGEDYRLTFHFSRFGLRKQHHAVRRIVKHFDEQFLFPTKVIMREHPQLDVVFKDGDMHLLDDKLPWFNTTLNPMQKRTVFNILRGDSMNMPYVIFGPPGTGKTVTLVEAALQLARNLPNARIMIGTPSNNSADVITKRIIESKALPSGDFIRLVSQNQIEKDLIPPELKGYCATGDMGVSESCQSNMIVTESGVKLRCQMKFLVMYRVIISTCATLGNFLQMEFPPNHFTHMLIDEAGQSTEPETVVPIVLLSRQRSQVVLAGDPHQLQPVIICKKANERGLNVSFLERLLQREPYQKDKERFRESNGYNPSLLTKLLYNYRALPSIMNVYSELFYDNELIPTVSEDDSPDVELLQKLQPFFADKSKPMPRTHGVLFHGIDGVNQQEPDSPSWYNSLEAREVFLTTILLYREGVDADRIGILTPYSKQVKVIRNMFNGADLPKPKIGSVEEFQGQERDIMLISTVRSARSILSNDARFHLGFVGCNKRMNVATSRARCLMIIFGNPYLLSIDRCWRHLILYCVNNNAYFGCDLPKSIESLGKCAVQDNIELDEEVAFASLF